MRQTTSICKMYNTMTSYTSVSVIDVTPLCLSTWRHTLLCQSSDVKPLSQSSDVTNLSGSYLTSHNSLSVIWCHTPLSVIYVIHSLSNILCHTLCQSSDVTHNFVSDLTIISVIYVIYSSVNPLTSHTSLSFVWRHTSLSVIWSHTPLCQSSDVSHLCQSSDVITPQSIIWRNTTLCQSYDVIHFSVNHMTSCYVTLSHVTLRSMMWRHSHDVTRYTTWCNYITCSQ